jgi:hypothetical protein
LQEAVNDYQVYDPPGSSRTFADVIPGSGLLEATQLSRTRLVQVNSAVKLIECNFNRMSAQDRGRMGHSSNAHLVRSVYSWKDEAIQAFTSTSGARVMVSQVIYRSYALAVQLVTFRYQPEKAHTFWSRLAKNSGLKEGDPELALLEKMLLATYPGKGDPSFEARMVASAWNAFYEGKTMDRPLVKDKSTPIFLLGTPYKRAGFIAKQ